MTLRVVLWHYLWITPHLLLIGVLVAIWRKKLVGQFPVFFAYVAEEVIQFLVLYPMTQMPWVSGYTYLKFDAVALTISTGLRFGVIHEIFAYTFRNYPSLSHFGKPVFRWGTAVFLMFGLLAAVFVGGNDPRRVLSIMWVLSRTASFLQCGLLLTLFLLSSYLGLSLRNKVFGVALGLGIFACVDLAVAAIRAGFGTEATTFLDYYSMAVYHVCVLVWLAYLWLPERLPQFAVKAVPEHDLESWNQELQRLIQQ
jgi:hypothetical protein